MCHGQQLTWSSLPSTHIPFQRPQCQGLTKPVAQSHNIDNSTLSTVNPNKFAGRSLNRRKAQFENPVVESENLRRRILDPRRPLTPPDSNLHGSWNLVRQVVNDQRGHAADN